MIDLGSEQVVEHLHGGGEQHPHVGLAGTPTQDLRQEGLPDARITNNDHIGALLEEVQIEQVEEAVFDLLAGFMMGELELVERRLSGKARELEPSLDGVPVAGFQFQVGQTFQSGGEAKILVGRFLGHRLQFLGHGGQAKLRQFLFQGHRRIPFGLSR